jgi:hypothetical protein
MQKVRDGEADLHFCLRFRVAREGQSFFRSIHAPSRGPDVSMIEQRVNLRLIGRRHRPALAPFRQDGNAVLAELAPQLADLNVHHLVVGPVTLGPAGIKDCVKRGMRHKGPLHQHAQDSFARLSLIDPFRTFGSVLAVAGPAPLSRRARRAYPIDVS